MPAFPFEYFQSLSVYHLRVHVSSIYTHAMYNLLFLEKNNEIGTICLNRPERHNALNKVFCQEIIAALDEFNADESVRVIRLMGKGKGFCSGMDLSEVDHNELIQAGKLVSDFFNPIVTAIKNSPKPVVAEVSGIAVGAGCSLALACDVVFASKQALFSLPFLKRALLPDTGSSFFLVRQLGYKKAFELFSDKQMLTALDAESYGLINHACDQTTLGEECLTYCANLALSSPESLKDLKHILQSAETQNLAEILELEAYYQDKAAKSPEFAATVQKIKARQ